MPHKKNHSAFDISNMFPKDNNDFGFNIKSSYAYGVSKNEKRQMNKRKKIADIRLQALHSGSINPISPQEEAYEKQGKNIYGWSRS